MGTHRLFNKQSNSNVKVDNSNKSKSETGGL